MEISYNELRTKEVVNLLDGSRMGRLIDMIISTNGHEVLGIVVMGERKLFRPNEDIFIPWKNISKIGDDVVLVNIDVSGCTNIARTSKKHEEKEGTARLLGSGDGDFI